MTEFTTRSATRDDVPFLREMQYLALFVARGDEPHNVDVVDHPDISRYYVEFGERRGDTGLVAISDAGALIGAAWVRCFPADDPGYGFVDEATPELAIAVVEKFRGSGVGSAMLRHLLGHLPRCSLSVDRRNPAVGLYGRSGFDVVARDGESLLMLRVSGG